MAKKLKRLTLNELRERQIAKMKYLKEFGFDFNIDPALPQDWLDRFAHWCRENGHDINYHVILSTTAWNMNGSPFGGPLTICTEVHEALTAYNEEP